MVSITLHPHVAKPITIPKPPKANTHIGTGVLFITVPDFKTVIIPANGPTELATSFAPWAKATNDALKI